MHPDRWARFKALLGEAIEAVIQGSNAVHVSNEQILEVTASLESRVGRVDDVIEVFVDLWLVPVEGDPTAAREVELTVQERLEPVEGGPEVLVVDLERDALHH